MNNNTIQEKISARASALSINIGIALGTYTMRDYQHTNVTAIACHFKDEWIEHKNSGGAHKPVFGITKATVGAGKTLMIAGVASVFSKAKANMMVLSRDSEIVRQDYQACVDCGVPASVYCSAEKSKSTRHPVVIGGEKTVYNRIILDEKRKRLEKEQGKQVVPGVFDVGSFAPKACLLDEAHHLDPVDAFLCIQAMREGFDIYSEQPYKGRSRRFAMYSVIIAHFVRINPMFCMTGLTGTWYRGTESVMGKFWQKQIGIAVDTNMLVGRKMLSESVWGVTSSEYSEMRQLLEQIKKDPTLAENGTYEIPQSELDRIGDNTDPKKDSEIVADFMNIMKSRNAALITCASKKHCEKIAERVDAYFRVTLTGRLGALLDGLDVESMSSQDLVKLCNKNNVDSSGGWVIVNQTTPDRADVLDKVRSGYYKFTIQMGILTTGVDVPLWDTIIIMRPIMSATLYVQLIGRGMRLLKPYQIEAGIKKDYNLILDYTGTSETMIEHVYDPVFEEANYQLEKKSDKKMKVCPLCESVNFSGASQCRYVDTKGVRCEHFWDGTYVECPNKDCGVKNNKRSHECRECGGELFDASTKCEHKHYTKDDYIPVLNTEFNRTKSGAIQVVIHFDDKMLDGSPRIAKLVFPPFSKKPETAAITRKLFGANFTMKFVKSREAQSALYRAKTIDDIMKHADKFVGPTQATHRIANGKDIVARMDFGLAEQTDDEGLYDVQC